MNLSIDSFSWYQYEVDVVIDLQKKSMRLSLYEANRFALQKVHSYDSISELMLAIATLIEKGPDHLLPKRLSV